MATESFTADLYFETKEEIEALIDAIENSREPNLSTDIEYRFITDVEEIKKN